MLNFQHEECEASLGHIQVNKSSGQLVGCASEAQELHIWG